MAIDENFIVDKLMELSDRNSAFQRDVQRDIAQMSGKIDGFLLSQASMQNEIGGLKARITDVEADVQELKTGWSRIQNRILGGVAVITAAVGAFSTFLVPYLKRKLGI